MLTLVFQPKTFTQTHLIESYPFIAVAPFTVTKQRSQVMTFAQPITEIYHSLFIKNPEGSMNLKSYVAPLTFNAWIAIGMFAIIGSLTLYLTTQ